MNMMAILDGFDAYHLTSGEMLYVAAFIVRVALTSIDADLRRDIVDAFIQTFSDVGTTPH